MDRPRFVSIVHIAIERNGMMASVRPIALELMVHEAEALADVIRRSTALLSCKLCRSRGLLPQ